MAKVIGPLFSLGASGTFSKFITYIDKVAPWLCSKKVAMDKITAEGQKAREESMTGRKALWAGLPVGQVNYLKRMGKKKKEELPAHQQLQMDRFQQALDKWRSLTVKQKALWMAYAETCHFGEWMGFALRRITAGREIPDEPPE